MLRHDVMRLYQNYAFQLNPRLQNAVVNIPCQVVQMTTSENVITYDPGMPWYHQSKVPRRVQRTSKIRPFLDLDYGLLKEIFTFSNTRKIVQYCSFKLEYKT